VSRGTVAVLTHWFDPTADHVVAELNRRGARVVRFDAADFPRRMALSGRLDGAGWATTLRLGARSLDLDHLTGLYFRRPTVFDVGGLEAAEREWAVAEARAGLGGLLATSSRWLNHPHRASIAEYKPLQLAQAAAVGLDVPDTLVTNEVAEARRFVAKHGQAIYKPLTQAQIGAGRMVYACVVTPSDLDGEPGTGVAATAHMFQERIHSEYAVRLTVVDGAMFAAAIHAHSPAAAIDWRADYAALSYERTSVPAQVRHGVQALMARLGLRFGAFDFLICPDGWVFLEVNPNGQWAWIETATGLPIAAAIADALTAEEAGCR
jgi:ATP-grasp ribosomal peptide maturase